MNNLCEFIQIGVDEYECSKCGMIIVSYDGPPPFICSYIPEIKPDIESDLFCSSEQIESRYKVCQACEYFIENSCSQCGCRVVRNAEFKNKLFFKNQECPIGKWKKEI
jgi:hypothetical protein